MHAGVKEFVTLPVNQQKFLASLERVAHLEGLDKRAKVLQDVVRAREAKIEAVPTFFIDGERIHVPLSINAFVDIIEARRQR